MFIFFLFSLGSNDISFQFTLSQKDKPEHKKKKAGLLQPLPVPKRPWESVT